MTGPSDAERDCEYDRAECAPVSEGEPGTVATLLRSDATAGIGAGSC